MSFKKLVSVCLCLALAGCASALDASRKSVTVGVHKLAAAAEIMGPIDQQKVDQAVKKAHAGDTAGAQADLDRWEAQFMKIQLSFSLAWDALRALADACDAIEKGQQDKSVLPKLLGALLSAMGHLGKDLADAGISVPGL